MIVAGCLMAACGGASDGAQQGTAPAPTPPPTSAGSCPQLVLQDGQRQGGACLDPQVMGEAVASRCGAYLLANGWSPDSEAETRIGNQSGRLINCYRAPR